MTQSLLAFNTNEIKVKPGQVYFEGYEDLKHQAQILADEIQKVEVTEDNIKSNKKMLAAVNKRVNEMSDKRISIKKEIMQPYKDFEDQVKEIVNIVKEADNSVRNQIKDFDERERAAKEATIEDIFNKRIKQYDFSDIFTFGDFISPKHLNKSTSMKSVETDMVEWLEKINSDLSVIQSLENSEEVMLEYQELNDLSKAINLVNERQERKERLAEAAEKKAAPKKVDKQETFSITVFDSKDLKMVEMFMEQNNIKFEKVVN